MACFLLAAVFALSHVASGKTVHKDLVLPSLAPGESKESFLNQKSGNQSIIRMHLLSTGATDTLPGDIEALGSPLGLDREGDVSEDGFSDALDGVLGKSDERTASDANAAAVRQMAHDSDGETIPTLNKLFAHQAKQNMAGQQSLDSDRTHDSFDGEHEDDHDQAQATDSDNSQATAVQSEGGDNNHGGDNNPGHGQMPRYMQPQYKSNTYPEFSGADRYNNYDQNSVHGDRQVTAATRGQQQERKPTGCTAHVQVGNGVAQIAYPIGTALNTGGETMVGMHVVAVHQELDNGVSSAVFDMSQARYAANAATWFETLPQSTLVIVACMGDCSTHMVGPLQLALSSFGMTKYPNQGDNYVLIGVRNGAVANEQSAKHPLTFTGEVPCGGTAQLTQQQGSGHRALPLQSLLIGSLAFFLQNLRS